jgi:uncharacterized protein
MRLSTVAAAIICKTPLPGYSKTRLSTVFDPGECATLSASFIRDIAQTIATLAARAPVKGYAVYTPAGSEHILAPLLPPDFGLLPQGNGDLGARLLRATADLLDLGHAAAILINSDSPTIPLSVLQAAVEGVRRGDHVVLGPALDGGYTLIGLAKAHARIFADIPWSTPQVYERTVERAREMRLPIVNVPQWYDVDDESSLRLLEAELMGDRPAFAAADLRGAEAPATRAFFRARAHASAKSS